MPVVVLVCTFHGQFEKLRKTKLWITASKKMLQIRLCRKIYREINVTQTALAHSEPSQTSGQTSKMEPFAKMVNYFCKKLHLRVWLYGGEFQPGLKFQLVKPWWDFISHVKRQNRKKRITIICKKRITDGKWSWNFTMAWTSRNEIFIPWKLVQNNHVTGLKMMDNTRGFKLENKFTNVSTEQYQTAILVIIFCNFTIFENRSN